MATFIRRPSGWLAQIRRTGHKSISRTFDTKVEAERWALSVEATMGQGKYVDTREAESTTLIECLDRYGREVTPSKKGASREMIRIGTLKKTPFAEKSIAAVRSTDVAAWRDARLQSGTAGNTVRLDLALLSHLYTIAIKEWGLPVTNPVTNIRKPPVGKPRDERCLPHQEEMILSELDKIHPELMEKLILGRIGELISPDYEDMTDTPPDLRMAGCHQAQGDCLCRLRCLERFHRFRRRRQLHVRRSGRHRRHQARHRRGCPRIGAGQGEAEDFHPRRRSDEMMNNQCPAADEAGGAGVQVTAYTQTWSDIVARLGLAA